MFTYNLHWEAEKSMLLYPKVNQEDSKYGEYYYNELKKKCKLGFVSVLDGSKIKEGKVLSQEIFDKLVC